MSDYDRVLFNILLTAFNNDLHCPLQEVRTENLANNAFGRPPQINDSYVLSRSTWCATFAQQQNTRPLTPKSGLSCLDWDFHPINLRASREPVTLRRG